jgi:hypothetical protein
MYPSGADNHKRGYCADGTRQIVKKGDNDTLPEWPQLQSIFLKGTHFYPIESLKTLQAVYERFVVDRATTVDVPIEYEAFIKVVGNWTTHRSRWHCPIPAR